MRQGHGAADHLVRVLGIDAQAKGDVHGFVKLGEGSAKGLGNSILHGKTLGQIDAFQRFAVILSMRRHDYILSKRLSSRISCQPFGLAVRPNPTNEARRICCAHIPVRTDAVFAARKSYLTSSPMLRAVPMILRTAPSRSLQFRSGIFSLAISSI